MQFNLNRTENSRLIKKESDSKKQAKTTLFKSKINFLELEFDKQTKQKEFCRIFEEKKQPSTKNSISFIEARDKPKMDLFNFQEINQSMFIGSNFIFCFFTIIAPICTYFH